MVLCTLAGLAAQQLGGLESGTLLGLLVGFVVAPFVPIPG